MKQEEINKKKNLSILERLKNFFSKNKDILKIRVRAGTQLFWVKDKKKIKYYQNLCKRITENSLVKGGVPQIQIIKVIYKSDDEK